MNKLDKSGGYCGYNKNNAEREPYDYYATPPEEVTNVIQAIKPWDLENTKDLVILEPCCGGGHMMKGILESGFEGCLVGSDITLHANNLYDDVKEINGHYIATLEENFKVKAPVFCGDLYDFCNSGYSIIDEPVDYIVMNPPFSLTIPFVNHALDIAQKGVLMFNRLQFIESQKRYDYIFKNNPPTAVYQYVDRVGCAAAGDFSKHNGSAQAYAWFYWDKENKSKETKLYWIRKVGKE